MPNKSGMTPFHGFLDYTVKCTVNISKCEPLGKYVFKTDDDKDLSMYEVLNNIHDNEIPKDAEIDHTLMEIMVPKYDQYEFKDYHAKRVLEWYHLLKDKIDNFEIPESE